jgi:hypothetical protein
MATRKAPGKKPAPKRTQADWERIEVEYRAGVKSLREMAAEHGISHVAIKKRADKDGWARDLSAKVQAKADALVNKALVTAQVNAETKITEQVTIEVGAKALADVKLAHRRDIGRGRALTMRLLAELEHQTASPDLFDQLGELMVEPDKPEDSEAQKERQRKLREAYQRVLSLPGRADTLKKLADALRILIDKEREAFGAGTGGKPGDGGGGDDPPAKILSDAERASRMAAILERARRAAEKK